MKRSFSLAFAVALPLLAFTTTAHAEQPIAADNAPTNPATKPTPPRPTFIESHPLMLRTGGEFLTGKIDGSTYTRVDTSLGIGYEFTPRVLLYLDVHYGTTQFGFTGSIDDGLRIESTLWSRLDISSAVGARGILMQRGPWRLDLGAEFESSIMSSAPTVEDLHVTTPQGRFDIKPYAQTQAVYGSRWYRAEMMSTLRLRLGPFEPRFGVGFEYIHGMLDVTLKPGSRDALALLGHDSTVIESPHPLVSARVVIAPGIDIRLGDRNVIAVTAVMTPGYSIIDSFGTNLMLTHRF